MALVAWADVQRADARFGRRWYEGPGNVTDSLTRRISTAMPHHPQVTLALLGVASSHVPSQSLLGTARAALNTASRYASAMRAQVSTNEVILAFGADDSEARRVENDYKGGRATLGGTVKRQGNVVLVWTDPPTKDERARVRSCLTQ